MKKIFYLLFLFFLLQTAGLAADYEVYVADDGSGSECSVGTPCLQTSIPWSTIETQRQASNDCYIYLKGGDTFDKERINDNSTSTATALLYFGSKSGFGTGRPTISMAYNDYYGLEWSGISNIWINGIDFVMQVNGSTDVGASGIGTGGTSEGNQQGPVKITDCTFDSITHYAISLVSVGDTLAEQTIIEDITCTDCANCIYIIDEGNPNEYESDYGYINNISCLRTNWDGAYDYINPAYDGHCVGLQGGDYWIVENADAVQSRAAFVLWTNTTEDVHHQVWRYLTADQSEEMYLHFYWSTVTPHTSGCSNCEYIYGHHITGWEGDLSTTEGSRPQLRINGHTGSGGTWFYHNTLYAGEDWGIQNRRAVDYDHWINNIVVTVNDDENLFETEYTASFSNHEIENNLYWTTGVGDDPENGSLWEDPANGNSKTWAQWQALGYDDNGVVDNPDFTNPGSDDFTLQSVSPARNAGKWLATVTQASNTGYTFTVDIDEAFYGNWSLKNKDGSTVNGCPITLYDATNGLQYTTVASINRGTGALTVDDSVTWIQNTTVVGVGTVYESAPDIGAVEYQAAGDTTPPTLSSVTIPTGGTTVQMDFNENITESGTGSNWSFTMSGGAVTLSSPNVSDDVITYTLSRTVQSGETLTDLDYTQPGNGIEDIADNDLVSISNYSGTFNNNSIQGVSPPKNLSIGALIDLGNGSILNID